MTNSQFLPKDSERFADKIFKSPPPENLSGDQISFFTTLIKDNPVGYEEEISLLKNTYPTEFGNVNPFSSSQINGFSGS